MKTFVKERIANLNNTTDVERWAVMYFKEKYKYFVHHNGNSKFWRSKPARKGIYKSMQFKNTLCLPIYKRRISTREIDGFCKQYN